jgi:acetolactate synthase-1/2/3 large subunit
LWDIEEPEQFCAGNPGGGLGHGIGASIGAALVETLSNRICIDLQADGDLLYTLSGLWTLSHLKLPLLIIMTNNRSYYNDEEHAENIAFRRGRPVENKKIGFSLASPPVDFAKIASGFQIYPRCFREGSASGERKEVAGFAGCSCTASVNRRENNGQAD